MSKCVFAFFCLFFPLFSCESAFSPVPCAQKRKSRLIHEINPRKRQLPVKISYRLFLTVIIKAFAGFAAVLAFSVMYCQTSGRKVLFLAGCFEFFHVDNVLQIDSGHIQSFQRSHGVAQCTLHRFINILRGKRFPYPPGSRLLWSGR